MLFPRPRILFLIALALAIPTWGISLVVFWYLKRSYDSRAVSLMLHAAKMSMATRKPQQLFNVNRGAIERMFNKFSGGGVLEMRYGIGVPFIRWGVLVHPLLNSGQPFTVRVVRKGGDVDIEASPGIAWWLLCDNVWIGRDGELPVMVNFNADESDDNYSDKIHDVVMAQFIKDIAGKTPGMTVTSMRYDDMNDFVDRLEASAEWYPNYRGMRFGALIDGVEYLVHVTALDPQTEGESRVRVTVS